jgi:hypothetical protein
VLFAELVELARTLDAEPRLERSRRVVDPRVYDAAVVGGLVGPDLILLLEDRHRQGGPASMQFAGDREPEDPGSDDYHVTAAHRGATLAFADL